MQRVKSYRNNVPLSDKNELSARLAQRIKT